MLPLHEIDKDQFMSRIIPDIKGKKEYNKLYNSLLPARKYIKPNVEFNLIKYLLRKYLLNVIGNIIASTPKMLLLKFVAS